MLSHRPVGILLNIRIGMSQVFKKPLERGRLIRAHFLKKDDFLAYRSERLSGSTLEELLMAKLHQRFRIYLI